MTTTINAKSTGIGGLDVTCDASGSLELQTGGVAALTIDTSQRTAFVAGTAAAPAITRTGDTNTGMFFPAADTIAFAEGGTEAMRLDANGNVGIGTSTTSGFASGKLIVASSGDNFVSLQAGTTNASGINMVDSVTGSAVGLIRYQHASDAMDFFTNGSQRMIIDSSGNVLVGTTTVLGSAKVTFAATAATTTLSIKSGNNGNAGIEFYNTSSVAQGYIAINASSVQYLSTSDYRLKENILPMTGALDKIAQLKPVTYTWKSDGTNGQGFIAHELQEVVPDCVSGKKDAVDEEGNPIHQGIDTSYLVATLTAAIQEQQTIINDLKARIETLESK